MGKPLAERQVGGLGIHLVREMMDELEYRRENDKNLLILKGKFGRTSAQQSPKNEQQIS
jgi:anti-sigma regulatory factor (Ser/Thr protein kinase)